MNESDESKPCWLFGRNINIRYAHYNGERVGIFLTFGFNQFGLGCTFLQSCPLYRITASTKDNYSNIVLNN